ncbi:MAG: HYR domain-containing protein [Proteobacteria bacterium]|nr:HYR domain-containing protein [Pseudomonadota bacterium]
MAPTTGDIELMVSCDDYCSIDVPGMLSVEADTWGGGTASGPIAGRAGVWYPITLEFRNRRGSNWFSFWWRCRPVEICDDGIDNDGDGLIDLADPDCQFCGNGVVEPPEQCDDGNTNAGDGCSSTCELENRPPLAKCSDREACADAQCQAWVDVDDGSYDPDGDALSLSQNPSPPYEGPRSGRFKAHHVNLKVLDGQAEAMCGPVVVTVEDCTPPTINCPAPAVIECVSQRSAPFVPPPGSATDNCSTPVVIAPPPGDYPMGSSELLYTASDSAGNTASCTSSVTVVDTKPPTPVCPDDTKVSLDAACMAQLPVTVMAIDACEGELRDSHNYQFTSPGSDTHYFLFSDPSGNSASCSQTVTAVDGMSPHVSCSFEQVCEPKDRSDCDSDEDEAQRVRFTVQDNCDATPAMQAMIVCGTQQIPVSDGQLVKIEIEADGDGGEGCEVDLEEGVLELEGPSARLVVNGQDASGNVGQCSASFPRRDK